MSEPVARLRVLVIEDNPQRIARIREWLPVDIVPMFACSAGLAMGILQRDGKAIVGIMLDHDLQEQTLTQADLVLSGSKVVETITRFVSRHVPILVHSMNPRGASGMARRLETAGFSVTRIPMVELTGERLTSWIEEVRENSDVE